MLCCFETLKLCCLNNLIPLKKLFSDTIKFLFALRRACSYTFPAFVVGFFCIGIIETFFLGGIDFYLSIWWFLPFLVTTGICFRLENKSLAPYLTTLLSQKKRILAFFFLEILFVFGFFYALPNIPEDFFWEIFIASFLLFTLFQIVSFFSSDDIPKNFFTNRQKINRRTLILWGLMITSLLLFVMSWIIITSKIQI